MKNLSNNKEDILDFLIDVEINYNEIKKVIIECKMLSNILNEMYNTVLTSNEYFKNKFYKDLSNLSVAIEKDNLSLFTNKYYI